jgi:hypothetical protein
LCTMHVFTLRATKRIPCSIGNKPFTEIRHGLPYD